MKTHLYRLEELDGTGIYTGAAIDRTVGELGFDDFPFGGTKHPTHNVELELIDGLEARRFRYNSDAFCAFFTIDQFRDWFTLADSQLGPLILKSLEEYGVVISEYACPERSYFVTPKQAVFFKDEATLVRRTGSIVQSFLEGKWMFS
jgi:hypothetical protein